MAVVTPTDLAVVEVTHDSVTISWADQTGGEEWHRTYYRPQSGDAWVDGELQGGEVEPGVTQVTWAGLAPGTAYDATATSFDEETESDFAVPVQFTTLAAPLTISKDPLPSGVAGEAYSATVAVTGGTPPYTMAVTAGALPEGLTLDPETGQISGTLGAVGSATFTLTVEDAEAGSDSHEYTIFVLATDPDAWVTYGTGRASNLDEMDGPGKFRVQVSDESWVSRTGRAFGGVDTTQIWPQGPIYPWRGQSIGGANPGWAHPFQARGEIIDQQGQLYRIQLIKRIQGYQSFVPIVAPGSITDALVRFIRSMQLEDFNFDTTGRTGGNFRHLRLYYGDLGLGMPNPVNPWRGWEVVSFGGLDEETMWESLEDWVNVGNENAVADVILNIWVWWPGPPVQLPALEGLGFLWAPTAPPSPALPLLVGVDEPLHVWGTDGGYIHPVDLTRRLWDRLGLRYDPANLDALEALEGGMAFPAAVPSVEDATVDPERWMETNIWDPCGLVALKDGRGRRKLVDARFTPEDLNLAALPVLNAANADLHRMRLVGSDMRNRWSVAYHHYRGAIDGEAPERLDLFVAEERSSENYDSDNVSWVNPRPRELDARQFLAPTESMWLQNEVMALGRGTTWRLIEEPMMRAALEIYQDGPVLYTGEIDRALAETVEEGSFALVDESELKAPNPFTRARSGMVLVIILSLTKRPAYADYEALRVRSVQVYTCPVPEDPSTWLVAGSGVGTGPLVLWTGDVAAPVAGTATWFIRAHKDAAGGEVLDLAIVMRSAGVEVASWLVEDVGHVAVTHELALTAGEVAAVTDWAAITVELARVVATPGDARLLIVSSVTLEVA